MALDADELAEKLVKTLKMKDKDGNSIGPGKTAKALAKGLVTALKAAKVMHPMVMGTGIAANLPAPNAGSFVGGIAMNGKIIGLLPAPLISELSGVAAEGVSPEHQAPMKAMVIKQATAITTYLTASSFVNFMAVEGNCTALAPIPSPFPGAPGALVGARAKDGKLVGIMGAAMTMQVAQAMGSVPPQPDMFEFYGALVDYLKSKTEVEYMVGTINGTFSIGGGALIGGIGMGGLIK